MESLPIELFVAVAVAAVAVLCFWRKYEVAKCAKADAEAAKQRKAELRQQRISSEAWANADRANAHMSCRLSPREIHIKQEALGLHAKTELVEKMKRFKLR